MEPSRTYLSPLGSRYSSDAMSYIWSDHNKYTNWRKLWLHLLDCQTELGVKTGVSKKDVERIFGSISDIDMGRILEIEKEVKHDVVAAMMEFSEKYPEIKEHIHKGATSQFIVDNSDSVCIRDSCMVLLVKAAKVVSILGELAEKYKNTPMVGMTHLQNAQPVTLGKRFIMWANDFVDVIENLSFSLDRMKIRGAKGATGTLNTFLEMFDGDSNRVKELNSRLAIRLGFREDGVHLICGQTYSRQFDASMSSSVCLIASASSKMCGDIRLLSSRGEVMEGFSENQVGSSAMPYKKNPISSEKVCSISRYLISLMSNFYHTASNQWLERSLDDSANRRITLPQLFLSADEILESVIKILEGIHVDEEVIRDNMDDGLYKFVSESIILKCTNRGISRGEIHSLLKDSFIKSDGDKAIFTRILNEEDVLSDIDIDRIFEDNTNLTGLCSEQVDTFMGSVVTPIRQHFLGETNEDANI